MFLVNYFLDLLDSSTDESKSIGACKAVSLIAADAVQDNPTKKLDQEIDIKSYQQQDWKSLNTIAYREDNSLQQLVSSSGHDNETIFEALIMKKLRCFRLMLSQVRYKLESWINKALRI